MGRIGVVLRLLRAAGYRRPGTEPVRLRSRIAQWLRCLAHMETFRAWFGDPTNPALQEAFERRPSLAAFAVHPYLNLDWPAARKLAVIAGHYAMLHGDWSFLRLAPGASLVLAEAPGGIEVRIGKLDQFAHEGELTLSLFDGEMRLYTLVFTLGQLHNLPVAYVGALQGLHHADALEIYRTLTQRMHGLRPRDLLLTLFRALCRWLAVERILAVSDRGRVSSSLYFASSAQVLTSYDSVWIENGGSPFDGRFFELTPEVGRRSAADVPARKRALYKRRYTMLDALIAQLRGSMQAAAAA